MPEKVLVIDPEIHIRRLVEVNLQRAGYEVETLDDYQKGLEKVKEWQPKVVVMEVEFPGNKDGGFMLLKQLNAEIGPENIGTVFLTDRDKDKDVFRGWHLGIDVYLFKPFNPQELLEFVGRVINGMAPV